MMNDKAMTLRWIHLLSWVFLLLAGGSAFAQVADPNARFLIERITVEGFEREAPYNIVTAETRLEIGQSYSEEELQEAVYRVKRLPFVYDAEYALRPGETGGYELVLTVRPHRVFTLELVSSGARARSRFFEQDDFNFSTFASVGARTFVGDQGLVFGSLGKGEHADATGELGYTNYGLFGGGSFASVSVFRDLSSDDFEATATSLVVGLPVAANQTVRSTVFWSRIQDDFFDESIDSWSGTVDWIYDTTDDPVITTEGTRVIGTVGYAVLGTFTSDLEADAWQVSLEGERHFRLTSRQSVSLALGTGLQQISFGDSETEDWASRAELGYSVSLWGAEKTERFGRFWLENVLEYQYNDNDDPFDFEREVLVLRSDLVFRNPLGVFRFGLTFSDYQD